MRKSRVWREAEAGFQSSYKLNSEKLGWITSESGGLALTAHGDGVPSGGDKNILAFHGGDGCTT